MALRDLTIRQISRGEFFPIVRDAPFPIPKIGPGVEGAFGEIVYALRFDKFQIFRRFERTQGARRFSVFDENGRRIIENKKRFTRGEKEKYVALVERTGNLMYFGFSSMRRDTKSFTNEIGFRLMPDGRLESVYACIPGHMRGRDCTWLGDDADCRQVYALARTMPQDDPQFLAKNQPAESP